MPRFARHDNSKATSDERDGKQSPLLSRWNWWALVPLALVCAAMAAPCLLTHGFLAIGLALERGFAIVCHQRPERSFWIFGGSVAVCSRCLGIYLGAAVGLLFRTSRAIVLHLLMVATALNFLDVASELAGLHPDWLGVRFALGFVLGATGALLISSSVNGELDRSSMPAVPTGVGLSTTLTHDRSTLLKAALLRFRHREAD